jgi:hypothetical protein
LKSRPSRSSRPCTAAWRLHAGLQNPHFDKDSQPLALTEGDIDDLGAALLSGVRDVSIADQGLCQATVLATRENTGSVE